MHRLMQRLEPSPLSKKRTTDSRKLLTTSVFFLGCRKYRWDQDLTNKFINSSKILSKISKFQKITWIPAREKKPTDTTEGSSHRIYVCTRCIEINKFLGCLPDGWILGDRSPFHYALFRGESVLQHIIIVKSHDISNSILLCMKSTWHCIMPDPTCAFFLSAHLCLI
jgi:hypothetical protein